METEALTPVDNPKTKTGREDAQTAPPRFTLPFRQPRPGQLSPRITPPTSSSASSASSSSDSDSDSEPAVSPSQSGITRGSQTVFNPDLVIEELSDGTESDVDRRLSVVRPIAIEDAESDGSGREPPSRTPPEIDNIQINNLACSRSASDDDFEEATYRELLRRRRELKTRGRRTAVIWGRRTLSEMIGSDSDEEDQKHVDGFLITPETASSGRRLRRRVGDSARLLFQDPSPPTIDELDDPDSSDGEIIGEALARELPFYNYVSMEIHSDLEYPHTCHRVRRRPASTRRSLRGKKKLPPKMPNLPPIVLKPDYQFAVVQHSQVTTVQATASKGVTTEGSQSTREPSVESGDSIISRHTGPVSISAARKMLRLCWNRVSGLWHTKVPPGQVRVCWTCVSPDADRILEPFSRSRG